MHPPASTHHDAIAEIVSVGGPSQQRQGTAASRLCVVAVFVDGMCLVGQHRVIVPSTKCTIHHLSQRFALRFGIPRQNQIIVMLVSPVLRTFHMHRLCTHTAKAITFSRTAAFLLSDNRRSGHNICGIGVDGEVLCDHISAPDSPHQSPTAQPVQGNPFHHTPLSHIHTHHENHPNPAHDQDYECQCCYGPAVQRSQYDEFQDRAREVLGCVLEDCTNNVTLQAVAKITSVPTRSLSLWCAGVKSRHDYHIARAVSQTVEMLRLNQFCYVPAVHDGCMSA